MDTPTRLRIPLAMSLKVLAKSVLTHGYYYEGECRNACVARWHAGVGAFLYWRTKFGERFLDEIRHPDDDKCFDVFEARRELSTDEVPDVSVIPDEIFSTYK